MNCITDAMMIKAYNIDTSNMLVFFVCYLISMKRKIVNLTQAQINEFRAEVQALKRDLVDHEHRWERGVVIRNPYLFTASDYAQN